jgi:trehalose-6-phosphatase
VGPQQYTITRQEDYTPMRIKGVYTQLHKMIYIYTYTHTNTQERKLKSKYTQTRQRWYEATNEPKQVGPQQCTITCHKDCTSIKIKGEYT